MRALIAGSTGFIGAALTRALTSRGVTVHPVVRGTAAPGEVAIDPKMRRLDTSTLPEGDLSEVDVVFNLAGEPLSPRRWGPAKVERIRSSRILTTDLLAQAIASAESDRHPVLVSMSATGYYGSRGDEQLAEDTTAGTGFLAEVCRSWEAATAPARDAGARSAAAPASCLVPTAGHWRDNVSSSRLASVGASVREGSGRAGSPSLTSPRRSGTAPPSRAFRVRSTSAHRTRSATRTSLRRSRACLLHRPALLPAPRPLLRMLLGQRVTDELLLASQRCLPRRLEESGFAFAEPELTTCLEKALERPPRP